MATDIRIRLGLTGENEVNNGLRSITQGLDNIGGRAGFAVSGLAALGSALGVAFSARAIISAADAVTVLNNQLKLVTSSTKAAGQAYDELFNIAQRSRVSFTELGSTYASIARAGEQLGISQSRLLGVTEAISNAVTVSGGSAESAKAALVQLSQGLASGTLRGDELNSVMEQTPRLASALAAGLGVTTGELRKMGEQGQITADKVISALESQSATLKGEVANSVTTVSQAWTVLTNATVVAVGEIDKASGASATLADAMKSVASGVGTVGRVFKENEATITTVMGVIGGAVVAGGIGSVVTRVAALAAGVGSLTGAFTLLSTALLANPVTLTLLGVGAVVGGSLAYINAQSKTIDGISTQIKLLNQENERSALAMARAQAAGRTNGADTIARTMAERTAKIKEFQAELQKLQGAGFVGVDANGDRALERADKIAYDKRMALKKAFDLEYASSEQKAIAEIKKQRAALGDLFTPADEAKIRAKFKGPAGPKVKQEASDEARLYAQSIEEFTKAQQKAQASTDDLTDSQAKLVALLVNPVFNGMPEAWRQTALEASYAAIATEQNAKATAELVKERESEAKSFESSAESAKKAADKAEDELKAYGLTKKALSDLTVARLRDVQAQQLSFGEQGNADAIQRQIDDINRMANALDGKAAREATDKAAEESTRAWQKTADDIERALTDSLMRGFESGKSVVTSLRDYIVNAFKTMVIKLAVQPVVGAITGLLGGGASPVASAASSAGGVLGNIGSLAGAFGSSFGAGFSGTLSAGFSGLGASLSGGLSQIGLGTAKGLASGFGQIAGTLGPIAIGIGAAVALADAMKYTVDDKGGAFVAQASGAGTSSVALRRDFQQNGGLFGGGTTQNSEWRDADASIRGYFDTSIMATTASVKKYADALGLAPNLVDDFKKQIEVSITGLDAAGQQAAIQKAIGGFVDSMVESAYGGIISGVAKAGETSGQTLERLASSLLTVNAAFKAMGTELAGAGIEGAQAASKIADAFGGLSNFSASMGSFFENFYSPEEKRKNTVGVVGDSLRGAGVNIGDDVIGSFGRDGYRALAESVKNSLGADSPAYVAIINASSAFASIAPSADSAAASIMGLVGGITKSVNDSIFGMQYAVADNQGKYNMLDVRGAGLDTKLRSATDINDIAKIAQEQIELINKSFGLLTQDQQKSSLLGFEKKLNEIDTYVTQKGADSISIAQARDDRTAKTIADAVASAVAKALTDAEAARQAKPEPAPKPVEVTVNVTKTPGVEVAVGYNQNFGGGG